jgi:hypothetical protein
MSLCARQTIGHNHDNRMKQRLQLAMPSRFETETDHRQRLLRLMCIFGGIPQSVGERVQSTNWVSGCRHHTGSQTEGKEERMMTCEPMTDETMQILCAPKDPNL